MGQNLCKFKILYAALFSLCSLFVCACGFAGAYEDERESTQGLGRKYVYDDSITQYNTASELAVSDKGYYYIHRNILFFYDVQMNVESPVCSKLDCKHDSAKCDAFIQNEARNVSTKNDNGNLVPIESIDDKTGINCAGHMIFSHNQKLYMIEHTEDGDYLTEYDNRYNNKKRVTTLTGEGCVVGGVNEGNRTDTAFLMNEYLYYMSVDLSEEGIKNVQQNDFMVPIYCYRVKLAANAKPEKLGEFAFCGDGDALSSNSHTKVIGTKDKVYFITSCKERFFSQNNQSQYRIAVYDCKTSEFKILLNVNADAAEDALGAETGISRLYQCCVDEENNLYFESSNGNTGASSIMKMSLDTLEIKKMTTLTPAGKKSYVENMLYDDNKIYVYVEHSDGTTSTRNVHSINLSDGQNRIAEVAGVEGFRKEQCKAKILGVDDYYLIICNGEKIIIRENDLWN